MKNPREIIISPIFSEKTTLLKDNKNVYSFEVSINANKIEIKKAIEYIFEVDVLDVNTIRAKGKPKKRQTGRIMRSGFKADRKKALVTLKAGHKIADFEI